MSGHSRPLISIVVPAYNSARFLTATLGSAIGQTEERWECVVIDDGSADDTYDVAAAYALSDPRVRAFRVPNGGASSARNQGFRRISPDTRYVTFMDSDDVWLPDALETLLERLERDPQVLGSHGLADFIDAAGRPVEPGTYAEAGRRRLGVDGHRLITWPLTRATTFDVLINGNVLFPPGLLLARRVAYELAGPFDESFSAAEDWDMLIRLSRLGDLEFVNRVILQYRRHDANLGARPSVPREAWLVRCTAFHSSANTPLQQDIARRGWRAYQVHLAADRLRSAWKALAGGNVVVAFEHLMRLPVYAWRYARGYPSPRVVRGPLTW